MSTKQPTARQLAAFLHRHTCHSVGQEGDNECSRPDGGSHAKGRIKEARALLASDDFAAALHDSLCVAYIHKGFHPNLSIDCPNRERHIEAYRRAELFA